MDNWYKYLRVAIVSLLLPEDAVVNVPPVHDVIGAIGLLVEAADNVGENILERIAHVVFIEKLLGAIGRLNRGIDLARVDLNFLRRLAHNLFLNASSTNPHHHGTSGRARGAAR